MYLSIQFIVLYRELQVGFARFGYVMSVQGFDASACDVSSGLLRIISRMLVSDCTPQAEPTYV